MKFYTVYTRTFKGREEDPEEGEVVEVVTRTDKETAEQDADLVQTICRRAAWIEESER